ncbi:mevalonate kinase [Nocardia crassostreae]|uniref:mevalonate kinase n=1 Tax=Nocardia crassostreae TaxID=53428 RepID=UPI00082E3A6B|nr:mevalonate kinase [Nocardia crassostreae]
MLTHPELADNEVGTGRASAKLILFGEHVVLYGRPAISLPVPSLPVTARARRRPGPVVIESAELDTGARATVPAGQSGTAAPRLAVSAVCEYLGLPDDGLFVTVHSGIPAGRGFGSSAASAAAIIAAIAALSGRKLDDDTMFDLIQRSEALAHGKASGVDARTVVSAGGPLWFRDGTVTPLTVAAGPVRPVLVVADTGVYGSTREAVATVHRRLAELGATGSGLLDRAEAITTAAAADLAAGRFTEIGTKMTKAHRILARLGVSCPEIETLVSAALDAEALGAKLSGGGLGGCVIALAADDQAAQEVCDALIDAGALRCHTVALGYRHTVALDSGGGTP